MSRPMATPRSHGTSTPADASTLTPGEPSAFMTTTAHSPDRGDQSMVCSPAPDADATQMSRSAGGTGRRSPRS